MSHRTYVTTIVSVCLAGLAAAQAGPVQITFGDCRDLDPVVSPNGDYLVFSSDRTGNFDIFLFVFGGPGVTQLTHDEKDDRYPSWGADNRTIVYSSKKTGRSDIYQITRDNPASLQITATDALDEYPGLNFKNGGLVFAQGSDKKLRFRSQMKVVGSAAPSRANSPQVLAGGDEPSFSPDGRKIVFVSHRTKNNDVWLMNPDGGLQTQLTTDDKDDENPRFSPDGRQIVFASNRTGNFDIWVMNADGSRQRQLTSSPADETHPCWSSGGYIYYSMERGQGKANIYRIKAPNG